jgi:hypothetical protein
MPQTLASGLERLHSRTGFQDLPEAGAAMSLCGSPIPSGTTPHWLTSDYANSQTMLNESV